jgi:hypothetical protein
MSGYPIVFANLAAGNQPLSDFDTMFSIAGQQGNIPCTASGTNAITITPNTNYYSPAAYTNAQIASFKAVATSTGAVTIQIGGLGLIQLYTAAGVQAQSGDVVSGSHYEVQYWSDLNSGSGAFIILNATVTAIANPVQAEFKNLSIAVASNSSVTLTADATIVQNASGGTVRVTSVNLTISTATNGANGLDSGTVANSTWYAVYVIYNSASSTTAGLLSTSATAPSLPSGYTYSSRLGWVRTNSSALLLVTSQLGRRAQYVVSGSGTTQAYPSLATGTSSGSSPTSTSITTAVPSTASEIYITCSSGGAGIIAVGPNTTTVGASIVGGTMSSGNASTVYGSIMLEGPRTTISYTSNTSGGALSAVGWVDNI